MIVATPNGMMRSDYTLTDSDGTGDPFGEVVLRLFRGGRLTVGSDDYEIETVDWTQTTVAFVRGGERVALARRPKFWRRRYEVTVEPEVAGLDASLSLELLPEGWFGRAWTVLADGLDAGRADWRSGWKARLDADLSDALPLAVRALLVAVLVVEHRRDSRNRN